jgi:predicted nuclease of predicted toxin-antitoxin system
MLFLADESCDFAVVRALRGEGHDVVAVAEVARGARDPEVVALARNGGRILLTEDKDFGWYVYAAGEGGAGDILSRSFTVIEPGRLRISATPPHDPQP